MKPKFETDQKGIDIPINQLTPNPNNPRPEQDIQKDLGVLMENLSTVGQQTNLIIDENGTILSGHRRLQAAKKLNWKTLRCDIKTGLTRFQKSSILFSANSTQKEFNVWDYREEINRMYWDEFLEEYSPKGMNDKGFSAFAKYVGLSNSYVKKIIDNCSTDKKKYREELKKAGVDAVTADEVLNSKPELIPHLTDLAIKQKKKEIGTGTGRRVRDKVRSEKRKIKLEEKENIDPRVFTYWLDQTDALSNELQEYIIDKADRYDLKKLYESLKPINKFYLVLEEYLN